MSKTALLELSNLTGPVPGREVKVIWEHRETPSGEKQVPSPTRPLAEPGYPGRDGFDFGHGEG